MSGAPAVAAIGHVVFDLDGTLVDSREDLTAGVNFVLTRHGRDPLSVAAVTEHVGDGARALIERVLATEAAAALPQALDDFLVYYRAHCLDRTRLYPGVEAALRGLVDAGLAVSVLTNKPGALAIQILDGLGLGDTFLEVLGGDTLATRKPHPAGLTRLAQNAGVPVAATLLVGDSPVDLATAQAAGAAFCGVAWGFAPGRLEAAAPAMVVDTPREIVALVRQRSTPS